jgi:hypothetical protein
MLHRVVAKLVGMAVLVKRAAETTGPRRTGATRRA